MFKHPTVRCLNISLEMFKHPTVKMSKHLPKMFEHLLQMFKICGRKRVSKCGTP
eukprot:TRINITY_DN11179_c0_g1_i1.p1 TRINITY_DN11179_c0_g1~~TRINITY_DN11179_c0_g1_i1.p1  ORF type:complete len:54 (+),score=3.68 TRINITY_DN11179_c0_g1_i1:151-312(+)